jgi:hypothetical protein
MQDWLPAGFVLACVVIGGVVNVGATTFLDDRARAARAATRLVREEIQVVVSLADARPPLGSLLKS